MARVTDSRFTVSKAYCAHTTVKHVLRFCGDYLASFDTLKNANAARSVAKSLYNEYLFLNESTQKGLSVQFPEWYKIKQQRGL